VIASAGLVLLLGAKGRLLVTQVQFLLQLLLTLATGVAERALQQVLAAVGRWCLLGLVLACPGLLQASQKTLAELLEQQRQMHQ
jgi:hypothetical protein